MDHQSPTSTAAAVDRSNAQSAPHQAPARGRRATGPRHSPAIDGGSSGESHGARSVTPDRCRVDADADTDGGDPIDCGDDDADGTPAGATAGWVVAAPFRAHVAWLLANTALDWRLLALLTGVPTATVRRLVGPRRRLGVERMRPRDARRLIAHDPDSLAALAAEQVTARGVGRRVRRLLATVEMADAVRLTGLSEPHLEALADDRHHRCTRLVEARVHSAQLQSSGPLALRGPSVTAMQTDRSQLLPVRTDRAA